VITTLFGFALVVYLIVDSGAGDVAHAMFVLGWWLLPISLFHLIPLFLSALSWRELLPRSSRLSIVIVAWIRWIRESINSLLPVLGVGGDFASARLANLRGVPVPQAAASMIVDTTVGILTQLVFVLSGVALLETRSVEHGASLVAYILVGVGIFAAAIAAFVLLQHRGMFAMSVSLARRLLPEKWLSNFSGNGLATDAAVVATYRSGLAFIFAVLWRLAGWAAGAGEIWLVMHYLGQQFGVIDAFILESLGSGVRAAAFMVPGALGAQESGFVLFGALFGLPPETALVISLSKRVRELALGLPGLLAWHWVERRHLLRRSEEKETSGF
jgi:putative membrane protein